MMVSTNSLTSSTSTGTHSKLARERRPRVFGISNAWSFNLFTPLSVELGPPDYIHGQGVIHRNVKPATYVTLSSNAEMIREGRRSQTSAWRRFAHPEQIHGSFPPGLKTHGTPGQYSLHVVRNKPSGGKTVDGRS